MGLRQKRRRRRRGGAKATGQAKRIVDAPLGDASHAKRSKGYAHMVQSIPPRYMGGDRRKQRGAYTSWCYDTTRRMLAKDGLGSDEIMAVAKEAYGEAAALFDARWA